MTDPAPMTSEQAETLIQWGSTIAVSVLIVGTVLIALLAILVVVTAWSGS